jgi:hypothetical protein
LRKIFFSKKKSKRKDAAELETMLMNRPLSRDSKEEQTFGVYFKIVQGCR